MSCGMQNAPFCQQGSSGRAYITKVLDIRKREKLRNACFWWLQLQHQRQYQHLLHYTIKIFWFMGTFQSFRKAYGALKDSTTVGLAKVNSEFKVVLFISPSLICMCPYHNAFLSLTMSPFFDNLSMKTEMGNCWNSCFSLYLCFGFGYSSGEGNYSCWIVFHFILVCICPSHKSFFSRIQKKKNPSSLFL